MLESMAESVMKLFDSAFVEEYKHLDQMACGTKDTDTKVYTHHWSFHANQYSHYHLLLEWYE